MSGALGPYALQQQYDPFTPLQKMADVGLTNTQITGGQIANQMAGLQLGVKEAAFAGTPLAPGGGSPSTGPFAPGATPPNGLASLATPSSGSGPTAGATGANPAAPQAGAQGAPQGAALPGDLSASKVGVAMPPQLYAQMVFSSDPDGMFSDITKSRQQLLYSAAESAATPDQWNQNVVQLAAQGWISSTQAQQLYGNYGLRSRIVQAQASPDENLKYTGELSGQGLQVDDNGNPTVSPAAVAAKGATAQATAYGTSAGQLPLAGALAAANATGADEGHLAYGPALAGAEAGAQEGARAPYQPPVTVTQRNPDGSSSQVQVPLPAWAAANGAPPATASATRAGDLLNPTQPIPASAYAARVTAAENTTGNPGAANASGPGGTPTSSAVGNGQFIDSTWLQLMQANRPDLTQGKTDAQILAMRSNPQLSQQMTVAYAQENAPAIASAGFPVNSATLGMAHRLGAENATTVMSANPNAPLSAILPPSVMAANPDLANLTAGSFVRASIARYGLVPVQLGQPQGASSQPSRL